jgi:hypothetical protein
VTSATIIDVGGSRALTALVGVHLPDDGAVEVAACETFQGDSSVIEVTEALKRSSQSLVPNPDPDARRDV